MIELKKFIKSCKSGTGSVFILDGKKNKATRKKLNLEEDSELLAFISNDGMEDISFDYTTPYRDKNGNNTGMTIRAYKFKTIGFQMYLAIFLNKSNKWILKSFHETDNPNPTIGDQHPMLKLVQQKMLEEK